MQKKLYSSKTKIAIVTFTLFLIICMAVLLFISEALIEKRKISDFNDFQEIDIGSSNVGVFVDRMDCSDHLVIEGWSAKFGEKIYKYNCHVALLNLPQEEIYLLPTSMVRRNDVSQFYEMANGEYDLSGFYSKTIMKFLPKNMENMEIIIIYQNNDEKMICHTNRYISEVIGG